MKTQIFPKPDGMKIPNTAWLIGVAIVAAAAIYFLIIKPKTNNNGTETETTNI